MPMTPGGAVPREMLKQQGVRAAGAGADRRWSGPRLLLAAMLLLGPPGSAFANCDLDAVVGYQLIFGKVIDGYIQDGARQHGYSGCAENRVLVFEDNTGVRCKETFVQHLDNPRGFLFARSATDMKLCVGDDIYDVAPAN